MTQSIQLIEYFNLDPKNKVFEDVVSHNVKGSKSSYQRIPLSLDYNDGTCGPLLLKTVACRTPGVKEYGVDGGGYRYTIPLLFDNQTPTKQQEEWMSKFYEIIKIVKGYLSTECGFEESTNETCLLHVEWSNRTYSLRRYY